MDLLVPPFNLVGKENLIDGEPIIGRSIDNGGSVTISSLTSSLLVGYSRAKSGFSLSSDELSSHMTVGMASLTTFRSPGALIGVRLNSEIASESTESDALLNLLLPLLF